MTTHMTKTWFDGKNIITQEIPETEIYKREWVGLTEDEIQNCYGGEIDDFARAIEAKLREKNT